jgi:uncharacterized protein (TIRG00374 family)
VWLRRGASLLLVLLVVEYLVLPQIAGTRHALGLLSRVEPAWLAVGVALEALSLASYSMLTRSMLPADHRPTYSWLLRTDLTSLGVSHVTPAGAATGNAVRFWLLRTGGTRAEDAVAGVALQSVGSAVVLNALLGVALVASVPFAGLTAVGVLAALAVALVVAASVVAARVAGRRPDRVPALVHRLAGWSPRRWRPGVERMSRSLLDRLVQLLADRELLRRFELWATLNWVLDAAALWVFLAAFGHSANPVELGVAYGLANVLAVLPVSPGGLGIVEAVAISSLGGFGAPRGVAVLGVVSWRLVEFWLPIPVAAACYASLQAQSWRDRHAWRAAIRDFRELTSRRPPDGGDVTRSASDRALPTTR